MTKEALKIISDDMASLGIEYDIGTYSGNEKGKVIYPYFVGEYQEIEPYTEDGLQETMFMLNGFSRGSWLALEEAKEKIERHYSKVYGNRMITADGSAVVIFYANSLIVPTGDAELKRIQINLRIKEWKVN